MQINFFTVDDMTAFFQSNIVESFEFIISFFKVRDRILVFLTSIIAVFIFAKVTSANIKNKIKVPFKVAICLITAVVILNVTVFTHGPLLFNINKSIKNIKRGIGQFKQCKEERAKIIIPDASVSKKRPKGELYMIVIGEASNKLHWSAYGYFRNTTPWALLQRQNNPNCIFFNNVYSSFVHTVPSLMKALTASNQYNKREDIKAESFIRVAQKAGFKVHWISNQNRISFVDNPLTSLIEEADDVIFTNKNTMRDGTGTDEILLPVVDRVLRSMNNEDNNLIIIHLIGSHFIYERRVPKKFKTNFKSSEGYLGNNARDKELVNKILNPYDTSILFTDTILERLYNKFQSALPKVKAFLYFSDHGEDVYGRKFHNAGKFTYEMTRIPMFILYSQQFKASYPALVSSLEISKNKIFTLDLFSNFGLSLMGIETSLNERQYNLTDSSYCINEDNALTMYSDESLDTSLYAKTPTLKVKHDSIMIKRANLKTLKSLYPNKKCFPAVYINAVGAALDAIESGFDGIEINVNASDFKMGHAPQLVYDTTLDEYLSLIPLDNINFIWLDMKNLKEEDIDKVIEKLNELDKKYKLKNRILVENTLVSPKMKKFSEDGWRNCFYLCVGHDNQDISGGSSHILLPLMLKSKTDISQEEGIKLQEFAYKIAKNIKEQKSTDLSFRSDFYPFVKKYLEPLIPSSINYNVFTIKDMPEIDHVDFIKDLQSRNIPILKDVRVINVLLNSKNKFRITL
ncbi:MAG: phosphoethanolamine transferase [Clostridiales Family XIII bacterium]|jgi:heptose-I-phosphate ethanolaminephosphotransferase|nr:phosphoethanolamine transferase [Clostridiales Family XIII bacterium]